jgi:hypothetical protein|tara:strand:+ start:1571 stop:1717 length:147 start_codon:yes stop_codon:yes gene_type:complete
MSADTPNAWGNDAPWLIKEKEYECYECGQIMDEDSGYCSTSCFKASLL